MPTVLNVGGRKEVLRHECGCQRLQVCKSYVGIYDDPGFPVWFVEGREGKWERGFAVYRDRHREEVFGDATRYIPEIVEWAAVRSVMGS